MEVTSDVSLKDITLISPKLTYVFTGHIINLVPEVNLSDLPHHKMEPTMHIELKGQVDELLLEIKQHCFVSIKIHFYEKKFWSYIVIKGVGQIKNVIIYDRSIFKIFEDAVMGEYDALQIINFSSITIKLKGASPQSLRVCISFIFITKIGKLSYTFRIIPLIIPFDRGHIYC